MPKFIYRSDCQFIYEEWLDTLPPPVAAAMRLYLPEFADCYRIVGDGGGHYFLLQVVEPFNDLPVTSSLLHGRCSSAAGMLVLGVPIAELLTCDCATMQFLYPRGDVERTYTFLLSQLDITLQTRYAIDSAFHLDREMQTGTIPSEAIH